MSRIVPIIALVLEDDLPVLADLLLTECSDVTVSDRQRAEYGWNDSSLQLGVALHAFLSMWSAGEVDFVRLPRDASGAG